MANLYKLHPFYTNYTSKSSEFTTIGIQSNDSRTMKDEFRIEDLEKAQQKLEQTLHEEILKREVSNSKFQAHFDIVNERLDALINIADSIRLQFINMNKINNNLGEKYVQGELKEQIKELSDGLVDSNENVDDNINDYDAQMESDFTEVEDIVFEDKSLECVNVTEFKHESIMINLRKLVPSLNHKNEIILNVGVNERLLELSGWKAPKRKDGIGVSLIDNDLKCDTSCKFPLDPLQSYVLDSLNCARKVGLFVEGRSKVKLGKNAGPNCSEFLKSRWDRIAIATCGELGKNVSGFMVQEDCETVNEQRENDLGDRETWSEGDYVVEFVQVNIYRHVVILMETEENAKLQKTVAAEMGRYILYHLPIISNSMVALMLGFRLGKCVSRAPGFHASWQLRIGGSLRCLCSLAMLESSTSQTSSSSMEMVCAGSRSAFEVSDRISKLVANDPAFQKDDRLMLTRKELFKNTLGKTAYAWKWIIALSLWEEEASTLRFFVDEPAYTALRWGKFVPASKGQGTEEQQSKWLPMAYQMQIIGCYAQIELGHGSNVQGSETTTTFHPQTDKFVVHSPTLTSSKWWSGGLGKVSTHVIVYARLIANSKYHGVHGFIVQIRSMENHKPLRGVIVGTIGRKFGKGAYNKMDNGVLRTDHVCIPRDEMLMMVSHVTREGKFKQSDVPRQLVYGSMIYVRQ